MDCPPKSPDPVPGKKSGDLEGLLSDGRVKIIGSEDAAALRRVFRREVITAGISSS